jgi:hypothetical protein
LELKSERRRHEVRDEKGHLVAVIDVVVVTIAAALRRR